MKNSKKFIFGIVLAVVGIIGGGLFAIANSLNIMATAIDKVHAPANSTCGIILFILLGVFIAGLVIMIKEITNKEEK